MLNKVAKFLTSHLVDAGVVSSDSKEIYIYGFEVLITSLLSTILVLIAGAIWGRFIETICFLVVFIVLRSFTGGFHANTYWLCTVVTLSIYCTVMLLSKTAIPGILYWLLLPVGVIVLIIKAPIRNPNKYMTDKEYLMYKLISIILFIVMAITGILLLNIAVAMSSVIYYTLVADLVLIFVRTHYVTNE